MLFKCDMRRWYTLLMITMGVVCFCGMIWYEEKEAGEYETKGLICKVRMV